MLIPTLHTAFPVVKTYADCADFSKTVAPYIPQLYDLPKQILARIDDYQALKQLYLSTNPLISAFAFALFLSVVVFLVAEINKNYSQVDRLWSIIPVFYNCHYALWAHLSGLPTYRIDHVVAVSILWGARLTFNYARKGGYSIGSEDYRWNIIKAKVGPVAMFIFDIFFIALAQNLLLLAITTPTYILLLCSRVTGDQLHIYDSIFSKAMLCFVVLEFYADQQQWNFHQAKAYYKKTAKVPKAYHYTREQLDRGFNTSGLWAWSRHPNFAAEQAFWVSLYQWSCCESWTYINWTFGAAISYLILFQASTWLTELLTSGKYSEYKLYQKRVSKFLPGRSMSMDAPKTAGNKAKEIDTKANGKSTGSASKGKARKR